MTPEERTELDQLQKGWDAKKLSKGKMLRYVYLAKLRDQQTFEDALSDRATPLATKVIVITNPNPLENSWVEKAFNNG